MSEPSRLPLEQALPLPPSTPHAISVPTHPGRRLGRIRNAPTNALPDFHHIKAHFGISPEPVCFDYSVGFPDVSGALFNDAVGNCAFAGHYHRLQVIVQLLTGQFIEGDALKDLALRFYEEAGGYNPMAPLGPDGQNPTDCGGDMEQIALFLMDTGLMLPDGTRDKFTACFSVDPHNEADMAWCAAECAGIGLGVVMTDAVMPPDGSDPPKVWPGGGNPLGGHFMYSFARSADGLWTADSWGSLYKLSPDFMRKNVDQAVAYVSADSLKDGRTVMGLSLEDWQGVVTRHADRIQAANLAAARR